MQLRLYHGQVIHARKRPLANRFVYPVFWLRLRVDDAPADAASPVFGLNRWRPLSLFWRDYGPRDGSEPMPWLHARLREAGEDFELGEVWLQTFPRVLGYAFNPVSFWLCHDRSGALRAVLAEVNNTFGDWCVYLLSAAGQGTITPHTPLQCQKIMHVSPFCRIEGHYEFRLRETPETSFIAIDYHDQDGLLIHTAIGGKGRPASVRGLWRALLAQPFLTFGVIARIHWQALRLWLGKVPFHRQPAPMHGAVAASQTPFSPSDQETLHGPY